MDKPYEAVNGRIIVELCGLVTLNDEKGENFELSCGDFRPWDHKDALLQRTENCAVVAGTQDGIAVRVYEHLHKEKAMKELDPYYNRDGVKKFAGQNDVYVVLTNQEGERRIYVIAHRFFPTRVVDWEAGTCRNLPVETGKRPDKPLSQPLDLSKVTKPENGDGRPSKELDQATKDAIAGEELDHGASKNGAPVKPPAKRKEGKNKGKEAYTN